MAAATDARNGTGILPEQAIAALVDAGHVRPSKPLDNNQVQPASLDLRLGKTAHRIRASFLPGPGRTVQQRLHLTGLHEIDLTHGAVLETGCVYLVPLLEELDLPPDIAADTNPKSSTGRLDIFTRVISDHGPIFDKVGAGYSGTLYLEISPRTFPVLVRTGSRLSQIRFRKGEARLTDAETRTLHETEQLVAAADPRIDGGITVSVDLDTRDGLVGYRAKRHASVIDVDRPAAYEPLDFWEPIHRRPTDGMIGPSLILDPGEFYILASKEAVHVPPDHAAEMVPFDPLMGEFRVHYAGFFDPGFGHAAAGGKGARAVLEVRSRDVPFIIEDGQIVGRLVYERLTEPPQTLYGADLGSNYQAQGLKLSKHFRAMAGRHA